MDIKILQSQKRITMKDIAARTGFTVNTVSRALGDKSDISDTTKKLVRDTAKEMGYIGNLIAGSLRSGATKTIAIILGDISNPLFAILVKEMELTLRENGYTAMVLNTDESYILEEQAILTSLSKNVDGIVICPTQKDDSSLRLLKQNQIPFVLFGRRFNDNQYDYVIADDKKGGYLATRRLIQTGRTHILSLNGPQYISSARERLEGYRKALVESGIEPDIVLSKEVAMISGSCYSIIKEVVRDHTRFDSIFAFNDLLAWEAIYTLNELGLKVPEDIAVVGFDNIQSKLLFPVPLTSVSIPKTQMARKTVEILLEKMEDKTNSTLHNEIIDVELVIRGTA